MVSGGGLDGGCGVWDGGASDLDELAGSGVGVVDADAVAVASLGGSGGGGNKGSGGLKMVNFSIAFHVSDIFEYQLIRGISEGFLDSASVSV